MIKLLVCGDVKVPKRNLGDAGIDFFVPNYSDDFRLRLIRENDVFDVFDNENGERSDIAIGKKIRDTGQITNGSYTVTAYFAVEPIAKTGLNHQSLWFVN